VKQIRDALAQLDVTVEKVGRQTAGLLGLAGTNQSQYFSSLGTGLGNILEILENEAAADRHLTEVTGSVERPVAEMSEVTQGVLSIGIQMQRVAVNATIQATQLGVDGGPLESVSHAIRSVASAMEAAFETLEQSLPPLRVATADLCSPMAGRNGAADQGEHLRDSIRGLKVMEDRANSGYSETAQLAAELKRTIQDALAAFGTQDDCLQVLSEAAQNLSSVVVKSDSPANVAKHQLQLNYTMQSERDVHAAVFGAKPDTATVPTPSNETAPEEENVEFF
jgi:hypothetical protein